MCKIFYKHHHSNRFLQICFRRNQNYIFFFDNEIERLSAKTLDLKNPGPNIAPPDNVTPIHTNKTSKTKADQVQGHTNYYEDYAYRFDGEGEELDSEQKDELSEESKESEEKENSKEEEDEDEDEGSGGEKRRNRKYKRRFIREKRQSIAWQNEISGWWVSRVFDILSLIFSSLI